jgi:hypothetical protein
VDVSLNTGPFRIGGYFVGRAMQSMLFGVRALDFSASASVALILLACCLPARGAATLEPMRVLRAVLQYSSLHSMESFSPVPRYAWVICVFPSMTFFKDRSCVDKELGVSLTGPRVTASNYSRAGYDQRPHGQRPPAKIFFELGRWFLMMDNAKAIRII